MVPRRLCPTTAVGRVPTFLGWMRVWGMFPDPPAQGVSLWIPPVHLYAAGFYGATLAQSFVFCNGGLAGFFLDGWSCCGLRRHSAEGLVWPALLSHLPTLQRFWKQGDTPCTPGGAAPLHPAGGGPAGGGMGGGFWRGRCYPARSALGRFSNRGTRCTPGGGCAPCPCLGEAPFRMESARREG